MQDDSPEVLIARVEQICARQIQKIEIATAGDMALGLKEAKTLDLVVKVLRAIRAENRRLLAEEKLSDKSEEELLAMVKGKAQV
jgi:hypothetical protein